MRFEFGLIISVGLLTVGIVYLASFDEQSEQSPHDASILSSLNNIEYDQFRDNDTHYDRVDREKKYYAAMTDIIPVNDESIQITFDANYFQYDQREELKLNPITNSEFIAIINHNQTFVAGCNSFTLSDDSTERIPVKQIHILKYIGVIENDGISYYGFTHEAGYVSDNIECEFPKIVQYSLDIDFDISETNFYGDVWDNDWE